VNKWGEECVFGDVLLLQETGEAAVFIRMGEAGWPIVVKLQLVRGACEVGESWLLSPWDDAIRWNGIDRPWLEGGFA
jgi:hypothetical protein